MRVDGQMYNQRCANAQVRPIEAIDLSRLAAGNILFQAGDLGVLELASGGLPRSDRRYIDGLAAAQVAVLIYSVQNAALGLLSPTTR